MKKITVFTPSYNRAYTLHLCYESLKRQTSSDFEWLIVDDGSSDGTKELVSSWMNEENNFTIRYVYKENGGMHTAHNVAYENIETELNVCVDSDDYLADDAIENIIAHWNKFGSNEFAGMIALDANFDGEIIGNEFPDDLRTTTLGGYYCNGGLGDKKLIYRTDVIKGYPAYPEFEGEKYVSLGYKYLLCDLDYELLTLNRVVCLVEYLEDGSSRNMYQQYFKNPNGFAFFRKTSMISYPKLSRRFVEAIHYVAESMIAKNEKFIDDSPRKSLVFFASPFGIALYIYLNLKKRRNYEVKL